MIEKHLLCPERLRRRLNRYERSALAAIVQNDRRLDVGDQLAAERLADEALETARQSRRPRRADPRNVGRPRLGGQGGRVGRCIGFALNDQGTQDLDPNDTFNTIRKEAMNMAW